MEASGSSISVSHPAYVHIQILIAKISRAVDSSRKNQMRAHFTPILWLVDNDTLSWTLHFAVMNYVFSLLALYLHSDLLCREYINIVNFNQNLFST